MQVKNDLRCLRQKTSSQKGNDCSPENQQVKLLSVVVTFPYDDSNAIYGDFSYAKGQLTPQSEVKYADKILWLTLLLHTMK